MSIFRPTGKKLLAAQCIAHLALIPMVLYATWWQWLIALVIYLVNAVGFTVTLHRYASHNGWNPGKWTERILVVASAIGIIGSALGWAAIHGKHHKYEDTDKDPHSPSHLGFKGVWLLMLADAELRYAARLLRNPLYRWQHDYYFAIILVYAAILFLISPFAVIYAFLCPSAIYWTIAACLNYFTHDKNGPKNVGIFNVLMLGEGYHLNHHRNQKAKRNGKYDAGWLIIRLLEKKTTHDNQSILS